MLTGEYIAATRLYALGTRASWLGQHGEQGRGSHNDQGVKQTEIDMGLVTKNLNQGIILISGTVFHFRQSRKHVELASSM